MPGWSASTGIGGQLPPESVVSFDWNRWSGYSGICTQGKAPKQALIAVAVKLLHTAHALIKQRAHFDPSRLLVAPQPASLSD